MNQATLGMIAAGPAVLLAGAAVTLLWWLDRRPHRVLLLAVAAVVWGGAGGSVMAHALATSSEGVVAASAAALLVAPLAVAAVRRRGLECPVDGFVLASLSVGGWWLGWLPSAASGAASIDGPHGAVLAGEVWTLVWLILGTLLGLASLVARAWVRGAIGVTMVAFAAAAPFAAGQALVAVGQPTRTVLALVGAGALVAAILLVAFVLWAEGRVLRAELAEEVTHGVLPSWAEEVFPHYFRRVRGSWWPERAERAVLSRLVSRLAVRKHALRSLGTTSELAWLEVVQMRHTLRRMIAPVDDEDAGDRNDPAEEGPDSSTPRPGADTIGM